MVYPPAPAGGKKGRHYAMCAAGDTSRPQGGSDANWSNIRSWCALGGAEGTRMAHRVFSLVSPEPLMLFNWNCSHPTPPTSEWPIRNNRLPNSQGQHRHEFARAHGPRHR